MKITEKNKRRCSSIILTCVLHFSIVLACFPNTVWASEFYADLARATSKLPSIFGVLHRYSTTHPEKIAKSWVSMSPNGMRITDLNTGQEIIKSFDHRQIWMVNRELKIMHELDLSGIQEQFPKLYLQAVGPDTQSNVLGNAPCIGWSKALIGERIWRGQLVEAWRCFDRSGIVTNEQMFNIRLGIVVKVNFPDSTVEELYNISEQEFGPSMFKPDEGLQLVGMNAFVGQQQAVKQYKE